MYTCTLLETLRFRQSDVTGAVSPSIGKLVNLKDAMFWGTKMSGPFPAELGKLKRLQIMQLNRPYHGNLDCGCGQGGRGVWSPYNGKPYESFEAGLADCVSKHGWETTAMTS